MATAGAVEGLCVSKRRVFFGVGGVGEGVGCRHMLKGRRALVLLAPVMSSYSVSKERGFLKQRIFLRDFYGLRK